MTSFDHIRSSLHRTFFSSKDSDASSGLTQREEFSALNLHFAPYERFDLSTGQQQTETSLQTLNQSTNTSSHTSIIDASEDNVEFLSKNSKRTLNTLSGVFCPIALSMFAISIFMRMGFVLAHAGVLQTLLQLSLCLIIIFCTLLSVCSLATNGAIEGGGVYHMISRALGPEFGGAIGVLFFFANVIGNGQSVAALVEALVESFGPGSKKIEINKKK
jgi:amino acid permease